MTMTSARSARGRKAEKSGVLHETWEIVKTIAIALLVALVLRVFLFQPFTIPSASMEPTLLEGDYIIVSKYAYGYSRHSAPFSPPVMQGRVLSQSPKRGDVVVFKLPRDGRTDYIKRLVGMPGDRVQVREGVLFINGQAVPRTADGTGLIHSPFGFERPVERYRERMSNGREYLTFDLGPDGEVDNTNVFTVPDGHYFMMGDSRDNSVDSRYPPDFGVGFVPREPVGARDDRLLVEPEASLFSPGPGSPKCGRTLLQPPIDANGPREAVAALKRARPCFQDRECSSVALTHSAAWARERAGCATTNGLSFWATGVAGAADR
jgi:signal peptidase I